MQQKGSKNESFIFIDSRDGKKYKTVKIGSQIWMAENLNYVTKGSKCYDNNSENCDKYGRLYNWNEALKACPEGWHLPTHTEWDELYRFIDGSNDTISPYKSKTAGKSLKTIDGWDSHKEKSGNGMDKYGFSALPGGRIVAGRFDGIGYSGWWISASETNTNLVHVRRIYNDGDDAGWGNYGKKFLLSIRCITGDTKPSPVISDIPPPIKVDTIEGIDNNMLGGLKKLNGL
jgi:uncharacterized protein (TIGR02145 family)